MSSRSSHTPIHTVEQHMGAQEMSQQAPRVTAKIVGWRIWLPCQGGK